MYMQSERPVLPKNYSGSAFSREGEPILASAAPPAPPPAEAIHEQPTPLAERETALQALPEEEPSQNAAVQESVPAMARQEGRAGGVLSHFPFLSSFLPPPRRGAGKEKALLPDWVLLGAVALLFLADGDNDILPFLLLLLLWD